MACLRCVIKVASTFKKYIIFIATLVELVKLIKLVFGSLLVSSAAMHLVGTAGCCLPLCSQLHLHRIVSIYSLLVERWI